MLVSEAYRNKLRKSRDLPNPPHVMYVRQSLDEVTLITMGRAQITAHKDLKG